MQKLSAMTCMRQKHGQYMEIINKLETSQRTMRMSALGNQDTTKLGNFMEKIM